MRPKAGFSVHFIINKRSSTSRDVAVISFERMSLLTGSHGLQAVKQAVNYGKGDRLNASGY